MVFGVVRPASKPKITNTTANSTSVKPRELLRTRESPWKEALNETVSTRLSVNGGFN
jgi:hypothetical protein